MTEPRDPEPLLARIVKRSQWLADHPDATITEYPIPPAAFDTYLADTVAAKAEAVRMIIPGLPDDGFPSEGRRVGTGYLAFFDEAHYLEWVPTRQLPRWQDVYPYCSTRSLVDAFRAHWQDPPPRPWKVHHTGRYRQRKARR